MDCVAKDTSTIRDDILRSMSNKEWMFTAKTNKT